MKADGFHFFYIYVERILPIVPVKLTFSLL